MQITISLQQPDLTTHPDSTPPDPPATLPSTPPPLGRALRPLFNFAPSHMPLNHGSYGTFPRYVLEHRIQRQRDYEARPSIYHTFLYPPLLKQSRALVAPLLGADTDEVVLVTNATTGVNVVMRNLVGGWKSKESGREEGEHEGKGGGEKGQNVVVYPSSIYSSCLNTLTSLEEETGGFVQGEEIGVEYPVEDNEIEEAFRRKVGELRAQGKRVRLAVWDTIVSGPGVRVSWERLVEVCRELGVQSLIDGAHGIGHIDLTGVGKEVRPDFLVTNCHKWLFVPRGCAVLYVPFENQHLIRTSLPTSHGYLPPGRREEMGISVREYFTNLFVDVATVDNSSFTCLGAALEFRNKVCGGEEAIRQYCTRLAYEGGNRAAEILGTEVMDNKSGSLRRCVFANVRLPLTVVKKGERGSGEEGEGNIAEEDIRRVVVFIYRTAAKDYDTYMQTFYYAGHVWTRFSAQVYLEVADIEWGARTMLEICERVKSGEWKTLSELGELEPLDELEPLMNLR